MKKLDVCIDSCINTVAPTLVPLCEVLLILGDEGPYYGLAANEESADVLITADLARLTRFVARENKNGILVIPPKSRSTNRLPQHNASYLQWQGTAATTLALRKQLRMISAVFTVATQDVHG